MKKSTPRDQFAIHGFCHENYQPVKSAFEQNFRENDEIGAAVAVNVDGTPVVDLWAGYADVNRQSPWEENTLVCVMSVTKAVASLCLLVLADQNRLELDAPIARYWPEFAQNGKASITVRCLLSQLAALPVADAAPPGSAFDLDTLARALEVQSPLWEPGTQACYHSFTYGPICQQLVRRVTGKTMGDFLQTEVLLGWDIDFYIGLSDIDLGRCADLSVGEGIPSLEGMRQPGTFLNRAWTPFTLTQEFLNSSTFRQGEFASANGHSNARAIARLYGILSQGGEQNNRRLISKGLLDEATTLQWDAVETMTQRHFRYASGFMLNNPHMQIGPNPASFGHPGLGGSLGFADPAQQIGFGYCCNRIHPIDSTGPCAGGLINALYECQARFKVK